MIDQDMNSDEKGRPFWKKEGFKWGIWFKDELKKGKIHFLYILVIVCLFLYINSSVMLSEECVQVLQDPCEYCRYGSIISDNTSSFFVTNVSVVGGVD